MDARHKGKAVKARRREERQLLRQLNCAQYEREYERECEGERLLSREMKKDWKGKAAQEEQILS